MNYFYLGVCGKGPMWPLEDRDSSASQLSPLLVSGWIYGEGVKTKRGMGSWWRGTREGGEGERAISLGFCTAAARSGVGDILEPSIVYTDHKHLGSKAE